MLKRVPDHLRWQSGYMKVALPLGASSAGLNPTSSRLDSCHARLARLSQRHRLAALLAQWAAIASKTTTMQQSSFGNSRHTPTLHQRFLS
ncbi:hypothetical protein [Allocoleopsis franciscana]|uniref:Uncharacterized protein n=1 Tax=Allocoleopsis franciscana PCC 7113 TaxID=1173027 RepID=K9W9T9_9CYAN|nr:hypothetical protein [Allocoleopsis franciscana]AFZ17130.1 hypothetical protein Mic7113_1240 [Allocoleopsis franciscana PCC 7113]